ncbi:hypothetical protein ACET3Z_026581 [Daucus carota]
MDSDGTSQSISITSSVAGRKRRGSGSALDEFLRNRLTKIQQRGEIDSGVDPEAGHGWSLMAQMGVE